MNLRAKTILSLSTILPLLAVAAFLLMPPAWAQTSTNPVDLAIKNCIYAGLEYSPGATIQGACPTGEVQTCKSDGTWGECKKPTAIAIPD